MQKFVLFLMFSMLHCYAVDITKFVTNDLKVSYTATGDDISRVILEIVEPGSSKYLKLSDVKLDPPKDNYSKSYTYDPKDVGRYSLQVTVYNRFGESATDRSTMEVVNRAPNTPTIKLASGSKAVMGDSVSFSLSGSDSDSNLVNLHLQYKKPGATSWSNFSKPKNSSARSSIDRNVSYSFGYSNYKSFGDYNFRAAATDEEGEVTYSKSSGGEIKLSPSNPEKTIQVKSQLRAEGDMEIWFNHSGVVTEAILMQKYRDIP